LQKKYSGDVKYSVKAAARATGVTESALRTWERRYGIPRPGRSPTGRRLYDGNDLEVIRRMATLVAAGVPASEAAGAVRTETDPPPAPVLAPQNPLVEQLLACALNHDENKVVDLLREGSSTLGWAEAVDTVYFPCLRDIGGMWRDNQVPSATEHFFTEIVRREINHAIAESGPVPTGPAVVLACPQDERHDVGLLALSLLLRQQRVRVLYLGPDVPATELVDILGAASAVAACIVATTEPSLASAARAARTVIESRLKVAVFVGGPAITGSEGGGFVPGIILPRRLDHAADMIAAHVKKEAP
jgi:DNA-binding transcriptional MerR regulator